MPSKGKPILRKNPLTDPEDESYWQAIAPKGWHFNVETSYADSGKMVYLCLERDKAGDQMPSDNEQIEKILRSRPEGFIGPGRMDLMPSKERSCLVCCFSECTAYSTICLKDHYGVIVGMGCEDWQPRETRMPSEERSCENCKHEDDMFLYGGKFSKRCAECNPYYPGLPKWQPKRAVN